MPTVHLITGGTGAGKTTYSRALALRRKAWRFTIDEWMVPLFHPDMPDPPDLAWALERLQRCETVMWSLAEQARLLHSDVVFDIGLSDRDHRDRVVHRARTMGFDTRVHLVDAPAHERLRRVRARNEGGRTYAMDVTDTMFEFMEGVTEPVRRDERWNAVVVDTMTGWSYRQSTPEDDLDVRRLVPSTLPSAFEAVSVGGPAQTERVATFVVEESGLVRGAVAVVRVRGPLPRMVALGPVAVDPAHQHRGFGPSLVGEVCTRLEESAYDAVVLSGNLEDYGRLGFRSAGSVGLRVRHGGDDAFLVRAWAELPPGEVSFPGVSEG